MYMIYEYRRKKVSFMNKMNYRFKLIIALAVILFVGYVGWTFYTQEISLSAKEEQLQQLEEDIHQEKVKNIKYENDRMNLNSPENIERIAREKLGMIKPNEKIYVDVNK